MQLTPKVIFILFILTYTVSCLPINIIDTNYYFIISFIITTLIYGFFLYIKPQSIKLITVFTLMVITSFIIIFYNLFWAKIVAILRIITLFLVIVYIYPKQKGLKLDAIDITFLTFVVILKFTIAYINIEFIKDSEFLTSVQKILYYLYATTAIICTYYSIRYYSRTKTRNAIYLLLFTFCFGISQIFTSIGYFTNFLPAYYFDRLLYLIALFCLIAHALKKEKVTNNTIQA